MEEPIQQEPIQQLLNEFAEDNTDISMVGVLCNIDHGKKPHSEYLTHDNITKYLGINLDNWLDKQEYFTERQSAGEEGKNYTSFPEILSYTGSFDNVNNNIHKQLYGDVKFTMNYMYSSYDSKNPKPRENLTNNKVHYNSHINERQEITENDIADIIALPVTSDEDKIPILLDVFFITLLAPLYTKTKKNIDNIYKYSSPRLSKYMQSLQSLQPGEEFGNIRNIETSNLTGTGTNDNNAHVICLYKKGADGKILEGHGYYMYIPGTNFRYGTSESIDIIKFKIENGEISIDTPVDPITQTEVKNNIKGALTSGTNQSPKPNQYMQDEKVIYKHKDGPEEEAKILYVDKRDPKNIKYTIEITSSGDQRITDSERLKPIVIDENTRGPPPQSPRKSTGREQLTLTNGPGVTNGSGDVPRDVIPLPSTGISGSRVRTEREKYGPEELKKLSKYTLNSMKPISMTPISNLLKSSSLSKLNLGLGNLMKKTVQNSQDKKNGNKQQLVVSKGGKKKTKKRRPRKSKKHKKTKHSKKSLKKH